MTLLLLAQISAGRCI